MRRLLTGVDEAGRSCVLEDIEMPLDAEEAARTGWTLFQVFETQESTPPPCPPGKGEHLDLGVAPGLMRSSVSRVGPGAGTPMHHTDTIDIDTVLEGSIEVTLDDGPHQLGPGDCVVMTGVDHAWKAGPDGCVLSVVIIGTAPRA